MKKLVLLTILLGALFVVCGATTSAQKKQRLNQTPKTFQTFYNKFRSAVVKKDKTTVASLTEFPLKYGFDAGDEGTFTKPQFLERFDDVFGGDSTFSQKNPVLEVTGDGYLLYVANEPTSYTFDKKGSSYKFTGYFVEP